MYSVNLIPARRRQVRRRRARTRRWLGLCAVYGALLLAGYLAFHLTGGSGNRSVPDELHQTEATIEQLRAEAAQAERKLAKAESALSASRAIGTQPELSVLLALLAKSLDDELVLSRCQLEWLQQPGPATVRYSRGKKGLGLKVAGFARTQAAVSRFVLRLERANVFDQVSLVKANREPFLADQAVAFLVECLLEEKDSATW